MGAFVLGLSAERKEWGPFLVECSYYEGGLWFAQPNVCHFAKWGDRTSCEEYSRRDER